MSLAISMAAMFFKDERDRVRKKRFYIGSLIAIIGSLVFVINGGGAGQSSDFLKGALFLNVAIFIQSIQNVVVKDVSKKLHSVVISASTAILSGLSLAGMYGMLMAFYILQKQGVVIYNIIQLVATLSTEIVGYFTLNEKINIIQGIGSILVVMGCVVALRKKQYKGDNNSIEFES